MAKQTTAKAERVDDSIPVLYEDLQAEVYNCCNEDLRGGGNEDCRAAAQWLDARPAELRGPGFLAFCKAHKGHAVATGQARLQVRGDLPRWEKAGLT